MSDTPLNFMHFIQVEFHPVFHNTLLFLLFIVLRALYVLDETDRWGELKDKGAITYPSGTSVPQTAPWIYQYAARSG